MNKKKKPRIRFKGFTDDWEQRKLIDLLDEPITDGPHETPMIMDSGIPFISADAIVNNKIDFSKKRGYITEEYNSQCSKKYTPELYDVYLVKSGSTVGKVAIVETTAIFNIWSPLAAMRCRKKTNPYFLYFLLQTQENQNQVKEKASNGTQPNLSMRILEKFDLNVPAQSLEQDRIGAFFRHIDSDITLHQRKCEKLKIIKKSMLENCFPKNGQKVPKIRFSGFTGDWEQRKVLDLLDLLTDFDANGSFADMAKNVNTFDGNGFAWYVRMTDLDNPKPLDELKYVDKPSYDFLRKTHLHGGELLMAKRGNIGKIYIFEPRTEYATVAPNMYLLKLNTKVIPIFLYNFFLSDEGKRQLFRLNASTTMGALYKDDVKNIDVIIPPIEEQKKIAEYFAYLDNLITLHQSKLEKLKKIKKSMLERMFV